MPKPAKTLPRPNKSSGPAPTAEQAEIIDRLRSDFDTLVIEAGAGTGKTTTLRMVADTMPGNGQYTAFNAGLVNDSAAKFAGTRVACNTTHSLAFRAVGRAYAHRLNGPRVRSEQVAHRLGIEALTVGDEGAQKRLAAGFLAGQVLQAIKKFCQSDDPAITARHFQYIDGIDMPTEDGRTYDNNRKVREYLLPFAQAAWTDLADPKGQLPFAHDHYVKIWQLGTPVIAADYILLDEDQDTSPVMLDVLRRQSAKLILVGDAAQQIYQWRGAVNAAEAFPEAERLYLTQSFRFGEAVADVANAVLDTLDERTELRLKGFKAIPSRVDTIDEPTAILCRTNATAVGHLLSLIPQGKRAHLVGGGADVISFVRAAKELKEGKQTSHPDLACFKDWTEVQEYAKADEGEDLKLMVNLLDRFGVDEILTALSNMPDERDSDLVISTAHKSKGREWESVRIAADFPTAADSTDSDRKLLYVAVTRAKVTLDVSACSFFNPEQKGIDISYVRNATVEAHREYLANKAAAKEEHSESILPATPSVPPVVYSAPQANGAAATHPANSFGWSKWKDGSWCARGPKGFSGQTVDVYRRDGSSQAKRLGESVWTDGDVAVYRV